LKKGDLLAPLITADLDVGCHGMAVNIGVYYMDNYPESAENLAKIPMNRYAKVEEVAKTVFSPKRILDNKPVFEGHGKLV